MSREKSKVNLAKNFAKKKHLGQTKKDGITPVYRHLETVVDKLKYVGITDEIILSAAWLHDVLESTKTSFDELETLFGRKTALLVLSLTKDGKLPKNAREKQYLKQLKESCLSAKLIKLCDIASNLQDIHNSNLSYRVKTKKIIKILHYIKMIKSDIFKSIKKYPNLSKLIHAINQIVIYYDQKPIEPKIK
ncbi:MAG: HD domain-containing protein [Candidatus Nitrosotenuis sp.]